MKKIRQHNDIDISLLLKNSQGEILNPEQCNKMSVRLRCGGFIVYKTPTVSAGLINIRFNAYEQHRTGEYDITLSAETRDGRTFTTDICKAFCIVSCSCETGGKTDEIAIDTIDVCATFDITAWGMTDIEDIDQIREGATKGMTALQEYYDDGSGEVVPVKHPDLSTQPNILPYKFAGNYVYEQMVWVDGAKFSDHNIGEIDLIKFQDYRLDIKSAVLIDHHVFIVGHEYYSNYVPLPYDSNFCFNIVSDDKRIFLKRNGPAVPTCKGVWIRVVWTTGPNAGGYYYDYNAPESKYNFHIKGFEGLSLSLNGEDLLKGSIEAVKLSDAVVEKFSSGTDIVVPREQSGIPLYVKCEETSEYAYMSGGMVALSMRDYSYSKVLSIIRALPNVIERLKNGEKITLVITKA